MDSEASNTTMGTESKTPVKTDLEAVPTSIETEAKVSPDKVGQPDTYSSSSASISTYTDTAKGPLLPGNTKPVSTENGSDEREDSDEEDDREDDVDSEDEFPEFEGGQPRGRIVSPVAGPKPKPVRPNN